jgi:TnpA family transposase
MFGVSPQWLIAPAAVAVVLAALVVSPETGDVERDVATYADAEEIAVRRDLQARQEAVAARIAFKDELIGRLIAGQATLTEVSGEFLRMNEGTVAMALIRDRYPGSSDEEKTAHNVLEYVRVRKLPAEQNARVFERLLREYERAYGQPCEVGG